MKLVSKVEQPTDASIIRLAGRCAHSFFHAPAVLASAADGYITELCRKWRPSHVHWHARSGPRRRPLWLASFIIAVALLAVANVPDGRQLVHPTPVVVSLPPPMPATAPAPATGRPVIPPPPAARIVLVPPKPLYPFPLEARAKSRAWVIAAKPMVEPPPAPMPAKAFTPIVAAMPMMEPLRAFDALREVPAVPVSVMADTMMASPEPATSASAANTTASDMPSASPPGPLSPAPAPGTNESGGEPANGAGAAADDAAAAGLAATGGTLSFDPSTGQSPFAQKSHSVSADALLKEAFEHFIDGQQVPASKPEKEALFAAFAASQFLQTAGSHNDDVGVHGETWQALASTNLRESPSATSPVVGEVPKGSTFRVTGHSLDGKWLRVETEHGLTGYYWAARAARSR